MTLVEMILKYRAENNISQSEFARRCNLSTQTVNSIENGTQAPSKLTKTKIMLVIGGETNDSKYQQTEDV